MSQGKITKYVSTIAVSQMRVSPTGYEYSITANVPIGYNFLAWINARPIGWTNGILINSSSSPTTEIRTQDQQNFGGDVLLYYLTIR